jgi:hypothetical protein
MVALLAIIDAETCWVDFKKLKTVCSVSGRYIVNGFKFWIVKVVHLVGSKCNCIPVLPSARSYGMTFVSGDLIVQGIAIVKRRGLLRTVTEVAATSSSSLLSYQSNVEG